MSIIFDNHSLLHGMMIWLLHENSARNTQETVFLHNVGYISCKQCENDQSCFQKQHAPCWWVEASEGISPRSLEMFFEKVHLRHLEYGPALLPDLGYCCIQLLGSTLAGSTLFSFGGEMCESWTKTFKNIGIYVSETFALFTKSSSILRICRDFCCCFFLRDSFFQVLWSPVQVGSKRPIFILRLDVSFQHHCR